MDDTLLIEDIKSELINYTGVELEQPNNNELLINCNNNSELGILLRNSHDEYKLFINEWSKHFGKTSEDREVIIDLIVSVLIGNARLQEFSKNNYPYKWTLQLLDSNSNWRIHSTTAILTLNIWTKPQIRYLQNDPSNVKRISNKTI